MPKTCPSSKPARSALVLELLQEVRVGGDDGGGREAGDVERLARSDAGDRLLGQLRGEGGQDLVTVAAKDEVVMDLVGDDEKVPLDGDPAEGLELLPRPHAADGVVRAAEDEHPARGVDLRPQVVEVHRVAAAVEEERVADDAAAVVLDGVIEGMINGRLDDDRVVRLGEGADRVVQGRDDARASWPSTPSGPPSRGASRASRWRPRRRTAGRGDSRRRRGRPGARSPRRRPAAPRSPCRPPRAGGRPRP